MWHRARGWTGAAAALVLAGCASPPAALTADGAWVRLGAVPGRPAAAYFTLHGYPERAATLIGVSTDVAIKAELHESMANGMRPIARVPIPAGAAVRFAPGGRHVMLFDVNPGIRPGNTMTLTFTFADGTRIARKARVIAAGDPAPG